MHMYPTILPASHPHLFLLGQQRGMCIRECPACGGLRSAHTRHVARRHAGYGTPTAAGGLGRTVAAPNHQNRCFGRVPHPRSPRAQMIRTHASSSRYAVGKPLEMQQEVIRAGWLPDGSRLAVAVRRSRPHKSTPPHTYVCCPRQAPLGSLLLTPPGSPQSIAQTNHRPRDSRDSSSHNANASAPPRVVKLLT